MAEKMNYETDYEESFLKLVNHYGGWHNAHAHLDRANTLERKYLAHMSMDPIEASSYSLRVKQNLTGDLHRGPAYEKDDLRDRMRNQIEKMVELGTKEVDSFIDVTADNVGLSALDIALELKEEFKEKIDFKVAAYPIFGFKDSEPERWNIFREGAEKADYLGSLPERDDRPDHIGYDEHLKRILHLAKELKKPAHFHVDQANDPRENGTETLIEAVRWLGSPDIPEQSPSVWAVHVISPSAYEEARFRKLLDGLLEYNIGVICCPSAAISMRQLRPIKTPTYNSIARVLEMLEAGVEVRIGSDNIADVFVPSGTPDLFKEVWLLSNAVRFYNPDIWAKVVTRTRLTDMDRELITRVLDQDREIWNELGV